MILVKALTSSKDNYSPLENKLVACYWDLADTDSCADLSMGHHINLWFSCPPRMGCYLTHQGIKFVMYHNPPSSNGSGTWQTLCPIIKWIRLAWSGSGGTNIYMKNWQGPKIPIPAAISVPASTYGLTGCCDYQLTEEDKTLAGFTDAPARYVDATQSGTMKPYNPCLGHPWRTLVNRNDHSEQNFEQCTCVFTVLGRRNAII